MYELQCCVRGYHLYVHVHGRVGSCHWRRAPMWKGEIKHERPICCGSCLRECCWPFATKDLVNLWGVLSSWSVTARFVVRCSEDIAILWLLEEPLFVKQLAICELHVWNLLTVTYVQLLLINFCVKIFLQFPATTENKISWSMVIIMTLYIVVYVSSPKW